MNLSLAEETSEATVEVVNSLKKIREAIAENITGYLNVSISFADSMPTNYYNEISPTKVPLSSSDWKDVFFLADKSKEFENLLSLLKVSDYAEFEIVNDSQLAKAVSLCWRFNHNLSMAELSFALFVMISKRRGRRPIIKLKLCRLV
ncbi:MAG: hypothetical protein COX02_02470 [Candidatus Vogelbacteria bacterium CG22_combo_CG10-13_8_21_14_all_37_9]|uniref:Uncharacterized protein n=1 Tax=Candidatus Vogelbacteria bacterium CG22_combo_CG10-13_8_21_14_all_37_9 TaxID=1975046 RepID=A0A2H0BKH9_9BACT|nr:MAG: hypothetical protein BK005_00405 [bacterium CG10_37_50]PIP58049.1 MAG: hypothetical protein COX02_02470 [Candidatus Vogelbacteria bacterium CG22_combo_CG10-13_8_21_14_all_37_9]